MTHPGLSDWQSQDMPHVTATCHLSVLPRKGFLKGCVAFATRSVDVQVPAAGLATSTHWRTWGPRTTTFGTVHDLAQQRTGSFCDGFENAVDFELIQRSPGTTLSVCKHLQLYSLLYHAAPQAGRWFFNTSFARAKSLFQLCTLAQPRTIEFWLDRMSQFCSSKSCFVSCFRVRKP